MEETKKTILLVEDEAIIAADISRTLMGRGYDVVSVYSGENAVERFAGPEDVPDLVLMDIGLGKGMDGVRTAERILAIRDVPVLFLSSHTEEEFIKRTERITSYGYVSKTAGKAALFTSITMAFRLFNAHRELKETERSLIASRETFRTLFEHSPTPLWVEDLSAVRDRFDALSAAGVTDIPAYLMEHREEVERCASLIRVLDINRTYRDMFGYSDDEQIPRDLGRYFSGEAWVIFAGDLIAFYRGERTLGSELLIDIPDKGKHLIVIKMVVIPGYERTLGRVLVSFQDITARKKAEEELEERTRELRNFFDLSLDLLCIADTGFRFRKVNRQWEELLGYSTDELIGARYLDFVHPDDIERTVAEAKRLADRKTVLNFVNRYRCKDGSYRWIEWRSIPMGDLIYAAARDITDRITAQKEAEASVAEKETLLKELQHRVKNNLGVISSLLSLEMEKLGDPGTRDIFRSAQDRIEAMVTIYEMLYRSTDLQSIALDRYIDELAGSLFTTYAIHSRNVTLKKDLEPLKIDMKRAVSLGLVVNELITNALKYAYPADSPGGIIGIELGLIGGNCTLRVRDEGAGLPEGIDPGRTGSLGMIMVRTLSEQIGGRAVFESTPGKGTSASVTFPL